MVKTVNLGFPSIGVRRELKKALESYWKGESSEASLLDEARQLRQRHWLCQRDSGIDMIPVGDFALYDRMLNMIAMLGAVPERFGFSGTEVDLATYFAMARGTDQAVAMEMTKWFDTNYHYIVPEFTKDQQFKLCSTMLIEQIREAKALGITPRPSLIGPVTFLSLGKMVNHHGNPLKLLDQLIPVYLDLLRKIQAEGITWVQIEEPIMVLELPDISRRALVKVYEAIAHEVLGLKVAFTMYFGGVSNNRDIMLSLPVAAVHVDACRAYDEIRDMLIHYPPGKILSLGIVDGRNIWVNDLDRSVALVQKAVDRFGPEKIWVGPSCSLLHVPVDLEAENKLDDELKSWFSFAVQKLEEIQLIKKMVSADQEHDPKTVLRIEEKRAACQSRNTSTRIHNQAVKDEVKKIRSPLFKRQSPYSERKIKQQQVLNLPLLPTTTIGSFPQTAEIRTARSAYKNGTMSFADYEAFLKKVTEEGIRKQEEIGIDVLVDCEFDRTDMVEHFGTLLEGFAFTSNGWVQSYGSRCVKPPIIFGDVSRPKPMTVDWSVYAQSLTSHIMKGMLTGPVTILQWSFVRDDQPRKTTCRQIALAIRKEVVDLEKAGIRIIQIDEPALREGLPLCRSDWKQYLRWAVDAFRLSAAGVKDETQIHTHMCYAEFNDIIRWIAQMDADVISIETSRSHMELLDAFVSFKYPNDMGPGVYDIHSPRVPSGQEMIKLLEKALKVFKPEQIWVNPDCGLKTRGWKEVEAALKEMVTATRHMRSVIEEKQKAS